MVEKRSSILDTSLQELSKELLDVQNGEINKKPRKKKSSPSTGALKPLTKEISREIKREREQEEAWQRVIEGMQPNSQQNTETPLSEDEKKTAAAAFRAEYLRNKAKIEDARSRAKQRTKEVEPSEVLDSDIISEEADKLMPEVSTIVPDLPIANTSIRLTHEQEDEEMITRARAALVKKSRLTTGVPLGLIIPDRRKTPIIDAPKNDLKVTIQSGISTTEKRQPKRVPTTDQPSIVVDPEYLKEKRRNALIITNPEYNTALSPTTWEDEEFPPAIVQAALEKGLEVKHDQHTVITEMPIPAQQERDRPPQSKPSKFRKFMAGLVVFLGITLTPKETADSTRSAQKPTMSSSEQNEPVTETKEKNIYKVPTHDLKPEPTHIKKSPTPITEHTIPSFDDNSLELPPLTIERAVDIVDAGEGFYESARQAIENLKLTERQITTLKNHYPKWADLDTPDLITRIIVAKGEERGYKGGLVQEILHPGAELTVTFIDDGATADIQIDISEKNTTQLKEQIPHGSYKELRLKNIVEKNIASKLKGKELQQAKQLLKKAASLNIEEKLKHASGTEKRKLALWQQHGLDEKVYHAAEYIAEGGDKNIAMLMIENQEVRRVLTEFAGMLNKNN